MIYSRTEQNSRIITPRHILSWHRFRVCSGDHPTSLMQNCTILCMLWIRGVGGDISRVWDGSSSDQEVGAFKNQSNAVFEGKVECSNLCARVGSRLRSRPCLLWSTSSLILLFNFFKYSCCWTGFITLKSSTSELPKPHCATAREVRAPKPWTPLSRSLPAKSEYKIRPPVVSLSSSSMISA